MSLKTLRNQIIERENAELLEIHLLNYYTKHFQGRLHIFSSNILLYTHIIEVRT
jgi:hypothetical protein